MGRAKAYLQDLSDRGFGETGDQAVCLDCVLDEGLRSQITYLLTDNSCSFCGRESEDEPIAATFEDFMKIVMDTIRFLYERSIESLFSSDDVTPRLDSGDVVHNVCAGVVTDEVFEPKLDILDDDEWNEDPAVLRPDVALLHAWDAFREKVKHEARFVFLSIPEEHSDHPDEFTTSETLQKLMEIIHTRGALIDIPGGHVFYRGRMIDDPETAIDFDAAKLGSPPPVIASANRMSPAGISMFYGSDDIPTVVAEIGAHSVSRFAVVGAFETIRPLQMVNLADLPPVPSLFDPQARAGYFESVFLHAFARDLSAPVAHDGREHIEYVATQVVTEYMRWLPETVVDGILFTSSQNGGRSYVVFCGPEGCINTGQETTRSMLRFIDGSVQTVRVVSAPAGA
jgi:hypothetical protein